MNLCYIILFFTYPLINVGINMGDAIIIIGDNIAPKANISPVVIGGPFSPG